MKLYKNGEEYCEAEFTGAAQLIGFRYLGSFNPRDVEQVIDLAVSQPVLSSLGGGDTYELVEGEDRIPVIIRLPSQTPGDLIFGVCRKP
jgi:hypothetical protein